MGTDLISALEKVGQLGESVPTGTSASEVPSVSPRQNEQSMALLQAKLANVQNAPVKKPRRA